jgi:hypothetical protein
MTAACSSPHLHQHSQTTDELLRNALAALAVIVIISFLFGLI